MELFNVVKGDYDLEKVRSQCIGKESAVVEARYPVEYEPIRRYCQMVDCANPLFLNPDYANKTKYEGVICPPAMVPIFALVGALPKPWPLVDESQMPQAILKEVAVKGSAVINMSQELEFIKPVKIGDRLSSTEKIIDIYMKGIKLDPDAIWVLTETTIINQHDEVVCKVRNLILSHRTTEEF